MGAFSGVMRSHDRGMSGGGCSDANVLSCSIVEVWNVPNENFPVTFEEANRKVLQFRGHLLPYIYNGPHTHARTHTHHTNTCVHTQTHTHTLSLSLSLSLSSRPPLCL